MTTRVTESNFDSGARDFVFHIRSPATAGTYPIDMSALDAYDIIRAYFQTDTGEIDVHFEIDDDNDGTGTDVEFDGGDELLSLTSTIDSEDSDSAYSVAIGDSLLMIVASATSGSPTLLSIDLHCRKTLV